MYTYFNYSVNSFIRIHYLLLIIEFNYGKYLLFHSEIQMNGDGLKCIIIVNDCVAWDKVIIMTELLIFRSIICISMRLSGFLLEHFLGAGRSISFPIILIGIMCLNQNQFMIPSNLTHIECHDQFMWFFPKPIERKFQKTYNSYEFTFLHWVRLTEILNFPFSNYFTLLHLSISLSFCHLIYNISFWMISFSFKSFVEFKHVLWRSLHMRLSVYHQNKLKFHIANDVNYEDSKGSSSEWWKKFHASDQPLLLGEETL